MSTFTPYRFGLDVDGVLRDFNGQLEQVFKLHNPQYIDEDFNCTSWDLHEHYPIGEDIYDFIWRDHPTEVFLGAPMYPTALSELIILWNVLQSTNGSLIFVTSQKPSSRAPTLQWLAQHIPPEMLQEIHIEHDKALVPIDYLLDDHLRNIRDLAHAGKRAICLNRPWNNPETSGYVITKSYKRVNSIKEAAGFLHAERLEIR